MELNNTRESVNRIAADYDDLDKQNPILQWMRKVVYNVYLKYIPVNSRVLELNAGTGIDALYLAGKGLSVYATDISDGMIKIIQEKIKKQAETPGTQAKTEARALSFDEISEIKENNFDAVISNFGGLNCINDFSKLSGDLADKLKPGGLFIAAVINKVCPWEIFYYLLKLDPKNAFRRFSKGGIMGDLNGEKVLTYYFTPGKFFEPFQNNFFVEKIYAHGYFTPPPYLFGIYNRIKPAVKFWMKLDEIVMGLPVINRLGDHFIIVMKKK
jgi:ubiquinone/menaquinone biosynthesis C-methylase UbiE